MTYLNLPEFKIDKNDPEKNIKELVPKFKPTWNLDSLIIEEVIGGYSSKMFKCFLPDQSDDAIIIRLQNLMDQFEEWKGEHEIQVIEHMSSIGHFPQIHAVFVKGYCYQYIVGKPLINFKLKTGKLTDETIQAIAEEMAFIHSIKIPSIDYESVEYATIFKNMIRRIEINDPPKIAPTKEQLFAEIDIIDNFTKSLNTPIVLCHGDVHPGNFVWNKDTRKIVFVDWEMTRSGYEFDEVAHFLVMFKMFDSTINSTISVEIPDNAEEKFLEFYFEARSKHKHLKQYSYNDYREHVEKFKLVTLLSGVFFPLIMPNLAEEVMDGAWNYYEIGVNSYLQMKKAFLGTDQFGLKK